MSEVWILGNTNESCEDVCNNNGRICEDNVGDGTDIRRELLGNYEEGSLNSMGYIASLLGVDCPNYNSHGMGPFVDSNGNCYYQSFNHRGQSCSGATGIAHPERRRLCKCGGSRGGDDYTYILGSQTTGPRVIGGVRYQAENGETCDQACASNNLGGCASGRWGDIESIREIADSLDICGPQRNTIYVRPNEVTPMAYVSEISPSCWVHSDEIENTQCNTIPRTNFSNICKCRSLELQKCNTITDELCGNGYVLKSNPENISCETNQCNVSIPTMGDHLTCCEALECEDGTTIDTDGNTCIPCSNTQAGTGGICSECPDGSQPNDNNTECISCPLGYAGIGGTCELCPFATQPSQNKTECVSCPGDQVSSNGICETCEPGSQPNSDNSGCEPCPDGHAGNDATCSVCPDGNQPNITRTECEQCPGSHAGTSGICNRCADGNQPNITRTECEPCPDGHSGIDGTCNICADGNQPNITRTECEQCPDAHAGTSGICNRCVDGFQPNITRTECEPCPDGHAGTDGTCSLCPNGTQPNNDKTECEPCPDDHAGTGGTCDRCPDGKQPNNTRTDCEQCPDGHAGLNGQCSECQDGTQSNNVQTECIPIICVRPDPVPTGYIITSEQLDLSSDLDFNVNFNCGTGYRESDTGSNISPCTNNGEPYTITGCTEIMCNEFDDCPEGQTNKDNDENIAGITRESCCRNLRCDEYTCQGNLIHVDNASTIENFTEDECCRESQCINPNTEGYNFNLNDSVTTISGFNIVDGEITCADGYTLETGVEYPSAMACSLDNTAYTVSGCRQLMCDEFDGCPLDTHVRVQNSENIAGNRVDMCCREPECSDFITCDPNTHRESGNTFGASESICCTEIMCNEYVCPEGKTNKNDSENIAGNSEDLCCRNLRCDEYTCQGNLIHVDNASSIENFTEEECCREPQCINPTIEGYNFNLNNSITNISGFNIVDGEITCADGYTLESGVEYPSTIACNGDNTTYTVSGCRQLMCSDFTECPTDTHVLVQNPGAIVGSTVDRCCRELMCSEFTSCSNMKTNKYNSDDDIPGNSEDLCCRDLMCSEFTDCPNTHANLYNSDNDIAGNTEEICCSPIMCDDFTCPDTKTNIDDAINTAGITEERCCRDLTCSDFTCTGTKVLVDNPETITEYTDEVCCRESQCVQPTTEGYDFTEVDDASVTNINGFNIIGVKCSDGYIGDNPTATVCNSDNTDYTVSGCRLPQCSQPDTEGYDFTDINDSITTIDGFNIVDGEIKCADGYTGSVTAEACEEDNTPYTVSGCSEIMIYCSNNSESNYDFNCGEYHTLKNNSASISCINGECDILTCCNPKENTEVLTYQGSLIIETEPFKNMIVEGIDNNVIKTNCDRIKNDILRELNVRNSQIVFRCDGDSEGKYDFSFDLLSSDDRPIPESIKKKLETNKIKALGKDVNINLGNTQSISIEEETDSTNWDMIIGGIVITLLSSFFMIVIFIIIMGGDK